MAEGLDVGFVGAVELSAVFGGEGGELVAAVEAVVGGDELGSAEPVDEGGGAGSGVGEAAEAFGEEGVEVVEAFAGFSAVHDRADVVGLEVGVGADEAEGVSEEAVRVGLEVVVDEDLDLLGVEVLEEALEAVPVETVIEEGLAGLDVLLDAGVDAFGGELHAVVGVGAIDGVADDEEELGVGDIPGHASGDVGVVEHVGGGELADDLSGLGFGEVFEVPGGSAVVVPGEEVDFFAGGDEDAGVFVEAGMEPGGSGLA